jgi:hypothetical protein
VVILHKKYELEYTAFPQKSLAEIQKPEGDTVCGFPARERGKTVRVIKHGERYAIDCWSS